MVILWTVVNIVAIMLWWSGCCTDRWRFESFPTPHCQPTRIWNVILRSQSCDNSKKHSESTNRRRAQLEERKTVQPGVTQFTTSSLPPPYQFLTNCPLCHLRPVLKVSGKSLDMHFRSVSNRHKSPRPPPPAPPPTPKKSFRQTAGCLNIVKSIQT